MELDEALLKIEEYVIDINPQQKCWVVRCDNGLYFNNFAEHSIVAIAHLDQLNYADVDSIDLNVALHSLSAIYQDNGTEREKADRIAQRQISLANRFLNEFSEDDIVITMDSGKIAIGYLVGEAYIERTGLRVYHANEQEVTMQLYLRRRVNWKYLVPRDKIPARLSKTLSSPQTVYSIHHKIDIYHMIHPIFTINHDWHFSVNLNYREAIKNKQIADLLSFFSEMEYYIQSLNNKEMLYKDIDMYDAFSLEIKASFMSPGEFWGAIKDFPDKRCIMWASLIYSFVFGNSTIGFDGIIDQEIRHEIFQIVKEKIENSNIDNLKTELLLSKPDYRIIDT